MFPLVSLLILLIAGIMCFIGQCHSTRKVLTFVSGILFVLAGTSYWWFCFCSNWLKCLVFSLFWFLLGCGDLGGIIRRIILHLLPPPPHHPAPLGGDQLARTNSNLLDRINLQWLSELRRLWTSVPWPAECELVYCIGSYTTPGQHSQPAPTSLGQRCILVGRMTGSLTCHRGRTGVERSPNKSQHRLLTLEKNILPPLLPDFELRVLMQ